MRSSCRRCRNPRCRSSEVMSARSVTISSETCLYLLNTSVPLRNAKSLRSPLAQSIEFGVDALQFRLDLAALFLQVATALVSDRPVEGNQLLEVLLDLSLEQHASFLEQPLASSGLNRIWSSSSEARIFFLSGSASSVRR